MRVYLLAIAMVMVFLALMILSAPAQSAGKVPAGAQYLGALDNCRVHRFPAFNQAHGSVDWVYVVTGNGGTCAVSR